MKKCISLFLVLSLCLGLSIPAQAAGPAFSDVPTTHWAYSYVERAAENGWVNGIGNNKFAPSNTLTFAEFYTMIVPVFASNELAAYQAPAGSPWWQSYMHVGAEYFPSFIISKEGFYGGPAGSAPDPEEVLQNSIDKHADEAIPRSDAITIMWQVLEENGLDDKVPGVDEAKTKIESTNGYLFLILDTAVPVCYAAGLVSGDENGNLNLDSSLTRAEGCVMLCNLVDYVTEHGGDVSTKPTNPGEPTVPDEATEPDMPTFSSGSEIAEDNVRELIESLKNTYPQGMRWTNDNYYHSDALYRGGYGCEGFALICSDVAFGDLPIRKTHSNFDEIRAGDMIRMNNDTHTVVVLQKKENSIIIAEGNYNSSINWGREISRQTLENGNFTVRTRYPN